MGIPQDIAEDAQVIMPCLCIDSACSENGPCSCRDAIARAIQAERIRCWRAVDRLWPEADDLKDEILTPTSS